MKDSERVTTVEAGRILGVDTRQVYDLIDQGILVGFRGDGALLLDAVEVDELAGSRTHT